SSIWAEAEQVFLPLWATGVLRHARANEGNHKAPLTGAFQLIEAAFVAMECIGIEDALLHAQVVAPSLFAIEKTVAEVEGARGIGQGNLGAVRATANHLDGVVLLVVHCGVKRSVAIDPGDLFDSSFEVKLPRRHGLSLR